jgi:hypothetical protein
MPDTATATESRSLRQCRAVGIAAVEACAEPRQQRRYLLDLRREDRDPDARRGLSSRGA